MGVLKSTMKLFDSKLIFLVVLNTFLVFGIQSSQLNKVASYVREGTASFEEFLSHLRRETRSFTLLRLKARHAKSRFNIARNFLTDESQQVNDKLTEELSDLTNLKEEIKMTQRNITESDQTIKTIAKEMKELRNHHDRSAIVKAMNTLREAKKIRNGLIEICYLGMVSELFLQQSFLLE